VSTCDRELPYDVASEQVKHLGGELQLRSLAQPESLQEPQIEIVEGGIAEGVPRKRLAGRLVGAVAVASIAVQVATCRGGRSAARCESDSSKDITALPEN
jgi:hypothetical protein